MPNLQAPAVLPVTALLAAALLMELLVYPAVYLLWKRREIGAAATEPPPGEAASGA